MTNLKIYIDFEAISSPFNREIKIKRDFPYAYSVGVFVGKRFKSKTFIFNFSREDTEGIYEILRINILRDIRELTGNKKLVINADNSKFISYAPALEKSILSKVYKGIKVEDISKGAMISIAQATEKYIAKDNYFSYLKDFVAKNVEKPFIAKRGLENDGALASIAGYYLYMSAHNQKGRFMTEDIDIKTLVKELSKYSKDDVVRMKFIENNKSEFFENASARRSNILKRNKINGQLQKIDYDISNLKNEDQSMTIEAYIKKMKSKRSKLKKKKDDLSI